VREAAEYPNSFVPLGPGDERIETERFTLCMSAGNLSNTVQRQRFTEHEVDEVLEEVRALLRIRGRPRTQWEIGSGATPHNLTRLLLARGLTRDREPRAVALALTRPPPPGPPEATVRRVVTLGEYVAANEVQAVAFGTPADEIAQQREQIVASWESGPRMMHAVWLDGRLVGAGTCAPTTHGLALFGGATLPEARRRGVYRALIAARWSEARSMGLRALVTQAGAMSEPILQSLGFGAIGRVHMLIDEFDLDYVPSERG
jgi:GNAT superfamily N-acetyltransferase